MTYSPRFRITNVTSANLTKIERARGFLEAAKLSDDWIESMARDALVVEAHSTTHIEGNQLTLEQSETLLMGGKVPHADADDVKELLNYRAAFDLVADDLSKGGPITEDVICQIHARLVKGVRGNVAGPGRYREVQNYVINDLTKEVIYAPPSPEEVASLMSDFVKWLQVEREIPPVLVAGVAQFQLVHIHPFRDGNGRTARVLSTLCLYRSGYDFKRLFAISEYYDRDRPTYYAKLQQARELDLDLTYWLEYFTEGLASQMREVQRRGEKAIKRDVVVSSARVAGLSKVSLDILEFLLDTGSASVRELEASVEGSRSTIQRNLRLLVERRLIRAIGRSPTDPNRRYKPVV
jgi:Fic family protein